MDIHQLIAATELPAAAAVGIAFFLVFVATLVAYFFYRASVQRYPAYLEAQNLEGQVAEKRGRLIELEKQVSDIAKLKQESDAVKAEFEYYRSQIERVKEEYSQQDSTRKRIDDLHAEHATVLDRLGSAETQMREAEETLIQRRIAAAESEKRQEIAERQARDLNEEAGSLEVRIAALRTTTENAAEQLRSVEADLRSTRQELEAADRSLTETKDATARKQLQLAEFDDQKRALEAEIELQVAKLKTLEDGLAKLESMRTLLAETMTKLEEAERDLKGKHETIVRLKSEEDWLNAELAQKKSELGKLTGPGGPSEGEDDALADLLKPPTCLARKIGEDEFEPLLPEPQPAAPEAEALHRVRKHLEESGFVFHPRVVNAFHTSLKTAVISPLTVLAGISGTGKSQLPRLYAEAMGMHFLKIPVQPRWDGPQDLFGFYNYIERRYKATDLARTLVHLDPYNWPKIGPEYKDRMLLVLLDEMNLARVEYYFSEFLSRLEGRPQGIGADDENARRPAEIEIDVSRGQGQGKRVYAGQNILFVGTMNEDESTLALSDKALDRANMLRFPKPNSLEHNLPEQKDQHVPEGYLPKSRWIDHWVKSERALHPSALNYSLATIAEINGIMESMSRPFGHRMGQAVLHYVANYPSTPGQTNNLEPANQALADQIELRILPRLRGVVIEDYRQQLSLLGDVARNLKDDQLAEEIDKASQRRDTNGLFVWRSFTRE